MTPTILLIEDNRMISQFITDLLSAHSYMVITATNGQEAFERLKDALPDLILLDYLMPRMDGLQFLTIFQQNPVYKRIPVIVVSTKCQVADRVRMIEAGADGFISKPFDDDELLACVKTRLEKTNLSSGVPTDLHPITMSGDLSLFPITDLVQVISQRKETGEIALQLKKDCAFIRFNEGEVVDIQFGRLRGFRAFSHLIDRQDGNFYFTRSPHRFKVFDTINTMELILEASRHQDECHQTLSDLPSFETILLRNTTVVDQSIPYEALKVLLMIDGRSTLEDILINNDSDELQTLAALKELFLKGMVVTAEGLTS